MLRHPACRRERPAGPIAPKARQAAEPRQTFHHARRNRVISPKQTPKPSETTSGGVVRTRVESGGKLSGRPSYGATYTANAALTMSQVAHHRWGGAMTTKPRNRSRRALRAIRRAGGGVAPPPPATPRGKGASRRGRAADPRHPRTTGVIPLPWESAGSSRARAFAPGPRVPARGSLLLPPPPLAPGCGRLPPGSPPAPRRPQALHRRPCPAARPPWPRTRIGHVRATPWPAPVDRPIGIRAGHSGLATWHERQIARGSKTRRAAPHRPYSLGLSPLARRRSERSRRWIRVRFSSISVPAPATKSRSTGCGASATSTHSRCRWRCSDTSEDRRAAPTAR